MTRPDLRIAFALMGFPGAAACYPAPARPAPQVAPGPPAVLDTVHRGTTVRFIAEAREFTGSVEVVSADSLTIDRFGRDTNFALAEVDTVWVRASRSHQGSMLGAGLGLGISGVILLSRRGPEDGATFHGALLVGMVLLGFGVLSDVVSPPSWTAIPLGPHPS